MFKYQSEMNTVDSCPPESLVRESRAAYRFVFSDESKESFLPAAKNSPSRNFSDKEKCVAYGLSVYDSYQNAEKKFRKLKKRFKNIEKKIGDTIAAGVIQEEDGECSATNSEGHFTVFEYEEASLASSFSICMEADR